MLTKHMQKFLILTFSKGAVSRKDSEKIYTNIRSFYSAMKYLKDCGFIVQYGGGKSRAGDISYVLTFEGFILVTLLTGIKDTGKNIEDKMRI